jgi:hypothetical protein
MLAHRIADGTCIRLGTSHFALRTSNFALPTSRFQLPTSNFPLPTSRFPLPASHFPLPTYFELLLSTSDFTLPHFKLQTSDFKLS